MNVRHSSVSVLALLAIMSCEKPVFPQSEKSGGDANGNVVVRVFRIEQQSFDTSKTRTDGTANFNRLNFAIYDEAGKRVKQVNQTISDDGFGATAFALEPGVYDVVVVAHSSKGNPTMTDPTKIRFDNSDGFTDTFLYHTTVEVGDAPLTVQADLKRIVSLCRVELTDAIPTGVDQMRFQYKGGSGAFNAATGLGSVNSTQTEFFPVETGKASSVYDLYTFLHSDEGTIHLQATAYDEQQNIVCEREFDVPMKRRLITKLSGPFFSESTSSSLTIVIGIQDDWEGEHLINF